MLCQKFTIYNLSVPHKKGVPKLKKNYAHVKLGLMNATKEPWNVMSKVVVRSYEAMVYLQVNQFDNLNGVKWGEIRVE